MADLTTVATAVLGILIGLFAIAYPEGLLQIHTAGRGPAGRHGEYGTTDFPDRWRLIVRVIGVVILLVGLYFGYRVVAVA